METEQSKCCFLQSNINTKAQKSKSPKNLIKHIHKKEENKYNGVAALVDNLQGLNYLLENGGLS